MKPTRTANQASRTRRIRKRVMLAVALVVTAALLSGCALLPLLYQQFVVSDPEPVPGPAATSMPLPTNDSPVARDADAAYESGAYYETEDYVMDGGFYPDFDPYYNTEEYASQQESGFLSVRTNPLSTFSADVDTASYCNLRRMLNDDYPTQEIPSGAVRIEEMLNYFRYDYAQPEDGERFAVTAQLAACPWNAENMLLMLGVRAEEAQKAEEGSNLVFLIDVSGSMSSEDKLDLAQQAMVMLAGELTEKDTVSIVTYASGEDVVIEGANPVADRGALISAILSLEASGSTNGERGLAQAYETAMKYYRPKGNNRVILCSDGDLNVGMTSESELHDYVTKQKETGVYLSVLGFGDGNYKDTKMETLADDGNGNYYYIDSILEARKVLCEEMTQTLYAVADDVKLQIEFNPAKVAMYRQIGYENRAMSDQDFVDDQKDAGEVGAGACVTVLYELVPADGTEAEGGLKYQQSELTDAAAGDEWLTLSLRYKEPGASESQERTFAFGADDVTEEPSGDFLFASAVAEFGMLLRDSEYAGSTDYASILDLLKRAPLSDAYREEFFSLVKIAQRLDALQ